MGRTTEKSPLTNHQGRQVRGTGLNKLEDALLKSVIGDREPRLVLRSDTRIDAGRWWLRTPLWVCVTEEEVVVLAAARRQYLQRWCVAECRRSHYCHGTGELVIESAGDGECDRLAMSPTDALQVLEAIKVSAQANRNTEAIT